MKKLTSNQKERFWGTLIGFAIMLLLCIAISCNSPQQTKEQEVINTNYTINCDTIVSKDTVSIDINKVTIVDKVSYETGKITTYLRYENRNYITDGNSVKNFINASTTTTAYIIYNNYANGERKVSKLYIKQ